jgi:hypothetical protein
MRIVFEKRQRIADIFAKVAEYTAAIVILGSIVAKEVDMMIIIIGLLVFFVLFFFSVLFEPSKEEV